MNLWLRSYLLVQVFVSVLFSQIFESKHFKTEKLSDGVFAVIHSFGGYAICNSGIIDLGDKVLVFAMPESLPQLAKLFDQEKSRSRLGQLLQA